MNRNDRRAAERDFRRRTTLALCEVDREDWPHMPPGYATALRVWTSHDYIVVLWSQSGRPLRLSVRTATVRGRQDITWDDLQWIKRQCGYGNEWAVEAYPPDDALVNVAPMRHLWLGQIAGDLRAGAP